MGAYYDALGAKFNDEPVLTKNVMSLEKYEVTMEEEEEAREAEAKEDEVCRQHQQHFLISQGLDEDGNRECIPM